MIYGLGPGYAKASLRRVADLSAVAALWREERAAGFAGVGCGRGAGGVDCWIGDGRRVKGTGYARASLRRVIRVNPGCSGLIRV